ncbi:hypothetical protein, conserved [Eimeria brunetti]|uniref:Transmembrane protein n=1 Tax=Eimeria brunetti TaxID=51314 RepID=U6LW36_9EIME|nr:hypothetical protein, conserved [Eimeria brunetti]
MSTRKPQRSRKAPRCPPSQIQGDEPVTGKVPNTEVLSNAIPAEITEGDSATPRSLPGYIVQNYITSMVFHAYIAFAPALLLRILRQASPFSKWSSNAINALSVFLANASWMELLNFSCTGDAGSAFIAAIQEKRFLEARGSSLAPAKKRVWLLGAISGLLGATTVGILIAAFSWVNPFGGISPLPQELFRLVGKTEKEEPSILADVVDATMTTKQRSLAAAFIRTVAVFVANLCPAAFVPLSSGIQNTAVFTSAEFYLELRHARRINLCVLLLAIVAGLPFCTVVGGPMLGISFAALVAGARLDPWCFILTASADILAALCATLCVRPVPYTFATVRTLRIKKAT